MPADAMQQRYLELLKTHDWTFEYSDDHYAWLRGRSQQREIEELAKHVDSNHALYNHYAPQEQRKAA